MLSLAICTLAAIALDAKKDKAIMNTHAALHDQRVGGMRDEAREGKDKAQGRCGTDTETCSDGAIVQRDPANTCRFAPCGTSLIEESANPTFQWTGVSISDDQNFCARMTPIIGDYQDLHVPDCSEKTTTDCTNHYEKIQDGNNGDIKHCRLNTDGTQCEAGAIHNCSWSFYMEDLIKKHNSTEDNCASQLLEAKRSLDGLLHSVQDVYNQLMQWNSIVQAENATIRGLLEDQQNDWDEYVSEQGQCDSLYSTTQTNLQAIENEMTELRAIANPDVRSAVDVRRARGYQSSGESSVSCPADYPYVHTTNKHQCCVDMAGNTCKDRNCKDTKGDDADCVDNARVNGVANKYGAGSLNAGQAASFVEMDEGACQSFTSLLERVKKTHGDKIKFEATGDCHAKRAELETDFKEAFKALGQLYNEEVFTMESNRSICLNTATYNYKAGVEGIDGIDDQIQDAAGKIHEAQGEIARLEPMLHDVERAVNRMRTYVKTITEECGTEEYIGHLYERIRKKIMELQECPGRNDFIIDIPHWRPNNKVGPTGETPVPTPWFEDPKAAATKSIL